ncbi:2-hydroxychromene-2-carboxylate isomerase [Actinoalloteichus hoggarensis]|uniref:Uncharacterized protein n=1 Tax=Actinoalloteichus hoggarensis TaxID=1470176 RepID=A0A221W592_9PSEU|nr:disulfide bond formation protein DsbA [Actinoalloteichus hoggarensis]ASO20826.1 hypothetical protein AHOG_16000 [Actinoalloteichus hoggarensis]MBB5920756.1 2-hydroxychromene-2-carboxylate isomerase [Actinoalloteichus hoggarensis]
MQTPTTVDFWFDPSCPYTWITSRWLVTVARTRPITVHWHVMSLSVLNEDREDDPEDDPDGWLWAPVRVCAAAEQRYGPAALDRLFTAMGTLFHQRDEWDPTQALVEAGLPVDLAEAAESTEYDAAVRASHAAGIALVGDDVGTPLIALTRPDGSRSAFFGPVISACPQGAAAVRLWDGLLLLSSAPGVVELKRSIDAAPDFTGLG